MADRDGPCLSCPHDLLQHRQYGGNAYCRVCRHMCDPSCNIMDFDWVDGRWVRKGE